LTDSYFAIVAFVSVAMAGYLVPGRLLRPAEPKASRTDAGRLVASLTDKDQKAVLARMRAAVKKREKRDCRAVG
jgi:hypothetical protein